MKRSGGEVMGLSLHVVMRVDVCTCASAYAYASACACVYVAYASARVYVCVRSAWGRSVMLVVCHVPHAL